MSKNIFQMRGGKLVTPSVGEKWIPLQKRRVCIEHHYSGKPRRYDAESDVVRRYFERGKSARKTKQDNQLDAFCATSLSDFVSSGKPT